MRYCTDDMINTLLDLLVDIESGNIHLTHWEMEQETIDIDNYGYRERMPTRDQVIKLYIQRS